MQLLSKFYDPLIQSIIEYLKLLEVEVNSSTVNQMLLNHPDWPSLLSISDLLTELKVLNAGGKIDLKKTNLLPTPFLAYKNRTFHVVKLIKDNQVEAISEGKTAKMPLDIFLSQWDGIYLIAEKTKLSGEKKYRQKQRKLFFSYIASSSFLLLLSVLFVTLFLHSTLNSEFATNVCIYIQYFLLFIGIIFSILLLWQEIDSENPVIKKVCTGVIKGNCNAILGGKYSKIFNGLSWSEVGFSYFTGGFLCLSFASSQEQTISIVSWLNILALPYTVFSFYYQSKVIHQWCLLCLSVQVLLLMGGANILYMHMLLHIFTHTISALLFCLLCYMLPFVFWYTIKPHLIRFQKYKTIKHQYSRLKFNIDIFDSLLKKQKRIVVPIKGLGIDLGNPNATNILVKVCNPFCSPCSNAHFKIEKLLDEVSNLKVKIIFTTPNDPTHSAFKPVSHFLAIAEQSKDENLIKQALNDWYVVDKKDYENFEKKHPVKESLKPESTQVEAMHKWCRQMDISYTPTIFINGYELPDAYNVEDLEYFFLELM